MKNKILSDLEQAFEKCSDCILSENYLSALNDLISIELSQEIINYLCEKVISKKHIWEIRFDHLRVLLLNKSSKNFDLKQFYYENAKKCRTLAIKIFFIRGYAIYANENEMKAVMKKLCANLENNHDYINYEYILSVAGLPYLEKEYGYESITMALNKAKEEYQKINPLLRGFFTLDHELNQINLLSQKECEERSDKYLQKL